MGHPNPPALIPDPATWPARIRTAAPPALRAQVHRLRTQLNLPSDRPILMTGHQPVIWHCGVLAKYLALDVLARRTSAPHAHPAWLVIDQERPTTIDLPCPALNPDGSLTRAALSLTPGQTAAPAENTHPAILPHIAKIADAINATDPALSTALRAAHACLTLARPLLRAPDTPTILPATALARTDALRDLITQMATDPWRCAEAYNHAARTHKAAGVRTLLVDRARGRCELPLWRLEPRKPARSVFAADLPSIPPDQLATKALLTTAIVRALACDLFIHGTGGGGAGDDSGYDRVMESWIADWNPSIAGVPLASALAPIVVATATRHLPFPDRPAPSRREIDHARWAARRARHDPALLGDHEAARARRTLVERIASIPRADRAGRAQAFSRLHALEADARARHASRLAELESRAQSLRARRAEATIIEDRTWPFPFFPAPVLHELASQIEEAIGA